MARALRLKLADRDAVIDKLVYTVANPVQDDLVDRVHHGPGVNGLAALLAGRPLRATRPLHFFRADGPMPATVEMRLTIPPGLGPEAEVLAELRERVGMVEAEHAAERQRTGRRVCGRRAVLAQSWRSQPVSREPRRNSACGSRLPTSGHGSRRCCATAPSCGTTWFPGRGPSRRCRGLRRWTAVSSLSICSGIRERRSHVISFVLE